MQGAAKPISRQMKDLYQRELSQGRQEQEPSAAVSAEEQLEQATADTLSAAGHGLGRTRPTIKERRWADKNPGQQGPGPRRNSTAGNNSPTGHREQARYRAVQNSRSQASQVLTTPEAETGNNHPPAHPTGCPHFTPKEKQATIREKPTQPIRARVEGAALAPTERPEPDSIPASHLQPPLVERMKEAAIKEQRTLDRKNKGGGTEGPPPLSDPPDRVTAQKDQSPPIAKAADPQAGVSIRQSREHTSFTRSRPRAVSTDAVKGHPSEADIPSAAIKEKPSPALSAIKTRKAGPDSRKYQAIKATERHFRGPGPKTAGTARAAAKTAGKATGGGTAPVRARQFAVDRTKQAAKTTASLGKRAAQTVAHAAAALVSSMVGLVGGAVLLVVLCIVLLVAAVIASPFGIFFASQQQEPGTVSPNGAIAQVNIDLAEYLAELHAGDYADIQLNGQLPDWREVLAVFAVRTALAEDGVDVLTLDPDRVERLKEVFWDMTAITAETEETEDGVILHLTVEAKTADEMRERYRFTDEQNAALDELLAETELLDGLITDLSISQADAVALVNALPEDLDPMRRAVVETACQLVGKVNYWWGGKSLTLGWDDRWGSLRKVTAGGSVTSGQYRPYGLDCSGMVDWVFYNVTGGEYIIGHGGGATAQHSYCEPITWEDAQPGDLVFYPEDSHVGIVGGRDEAGQLLIIHCASGYNNTVITGLEGFTVIGKPEFYATSGRDSKESRPDVKTKLSSMIVLYHIRKCYR